MSNAHDTPSAEAAWLAVATLIASNVLTHRRLPTSVYVPWNLTVAGGLVALAKASGHTMEDMGLDPRRLGRGARLGGTGAVLVGAAYAALLGTRRRHRLLTDHRLIGLTRRDTLFRLLVQIPLGTALAEEVVFRGVLPLVLRDPRHPVWASPVIASLLFGLWHLLPAHAAADANRAPVGRRMVGTVLSTAIAGGILHGLRHRAGHIVAPAALHFATNGLGLLAVRIAGSSR